MTVRLLECSRKIVTNGRCRTRQLTQTVNDESKTLSVDDENLIINQLPLIKAKVANNNNSDVPKSNAREQYLQNKFHVVRDIFKSYSNDERYISFKLPTNFDSPFDAAIVKKKVILGESSIKTTGTGRLSVTKLLTKRWCELREAYDIFSKVPIYENAQVKGGRMAHKKLEDQAHPVPKEWNQFVEDFELPIPKDKFHNYTEELFDCSMRLLSLFITGEAREILCHGYLDRDTGEFIKDVATSENHILVSGIIDHLTLTSKQDNTGEILRDTKPRGFASVGIHDHIDDFNTLFEWLDLNQQALRDSYEVIVSDVKTRAFRNVPSQTSVVTSAKYQVMYYRKFLDILSLNPEVAYNNILINAQRRGFDIDKPINPAKLISFMESNCIIFPDMRRLRDGEDLNFKPYDIDSKRYYNDNDNGYSMTSYSDLITDLRVIEKYEEFFVQWSTPVTIRYFAARLAQMYYRMGTLLSDELLIEYYCNGEMFHSIPFKFNDAKLSNLTLESSLFWFGKREIEPIKQTVSNLLTYCKYCDYSSVCAWKKNGEEHNKNLGKELQELFETK